MDDSDDGSDIAALAANKPLPSSSSSNTVSTTGRDPDADTGTSWEDLGHDDQPAQDTDRSRPSTAYKMAGANQGKEQDDGHSLEDSDDGLHDVPTPTQEIQMPPLTTLHSNNIPDLRLPVASQRHSPDNSSHQQQDSLSPGQASYVEGGSTSALPIRDPNDSYTAHMVRRRLQDMESSFTQPISPLPTINSLGFDDTFVFDSPSKPPKSAASSASKPSSAPPRSIPCDEPSLPELPPGGTGKSPQLKPEPSSQERKLNMPMDTSALEGFSSPSGDSLSRTVSRAVSGVSAAKYAPGENSAPPSNDGESVVHRDLPSDDSFLHPASASGSQKAKEKNIPKINVDAGATSSGLHKAGTRPKYLRSRMSSQRSSDSSITGDDMESDATVGTGGLGVDYVLQSGGAVPAHAMSRNSSMGNLITRQISMGSVVSDFREDSTGRIGLDPLEPLDEDEDYQSGERVKTPKAPRQPLTDPTDTVIARHVRNVQVPESLAREYKTKGGFVTPLRKMSEVNLGASASTTRTGRNLTLKEQSSTIERLSKENFDLKLKVMFLSDRLDKLSEEGIKEMISENVELKTSLAVMQRDNKVLRRRVKELEKKLKDEDERPGTARSGVSSNGPTAEDYEQHAANEEELIYLRERVEEFITEIERLKSENLNKEAEKRRMAEVVKSLQTINESRMGDSMGQDDETEVWRELYSQETGRREQVEEENQRLGDENKKLRDEVFRLKQELVNGTNNPGGAPSGLHHTTNIYNITRKPRAGSPTRPKSRISEAETMNGTTSVSVTIVDELRRESEQLRHENAELRREVGAQTSMLTSRNREKERLYQEIEDLKMAQRRSGTASTTYDSILDRSASRAGVHDRPTSRGSQLTPTAPLEEDPEREELENKLAEFRDKLNNVKMQNQDLQQELSAYMQEYEAELEGRKQAEAAALQLQEELEATQNDLMALQQERDELLEENSAMDIEFNNLRTEAQDEIDQLEAESEQREAEVARLNQELAERSENQEALQEEMRRLSDDMIRFEDTQDTQLKRIKQLEEELAQANSELEDLEDKLVAANEKAERLAIQQESNQGEITFLREEQETDKLKIGDLIGQVAQLEVVLKEERDKTKELETQIQNERQQHEMISSQEKEEVQQVVNQLNKEMIGAKEEARRLRKNLSKQEVEAAQWKERLIDLESNLREALGDLNGTRSSFLKDISKLQNDLESTCRELDSTRASLKEKEHYIKQRDELLESSALEARRLAEMFDKEKSLHRSTQQRLDTYEKTHKHVQGSVSSAELRIKELETSKDREKQKMAKLETTLKEQLNERNSLLLVLWTKLSSLCGTDWAHDNSLINGRALPSLESVSTMLPGFSKNLLAAIKTIESIVSKFQDRVKSVERELWKEYQHLEDSLDKRIKKLDRLESIVRNGVATGTIGVNSALSQTMIEEQRQRIQRLQDQIRHLTVENTTLRTANEVRARTAHETMLDPLGDRHFDGGSPSPAVPTGPREGSVRTTTERGRGSRQSSRTYVTGAGASSSSSLRHETSRSRPPTLTRARTENEAMTTLRTSTELASRDYDPGPASAGVEASTALLSPGAPVGADIQWMHRLKDMERKLKAEREGRMLDRSEASRRLLDLEEVARDAQAREAKREKHRKLTQQQQGSSNSRSNSAAGDHN